MAYDEQLADRVREIVAGSGDFSERKMFGGLAFMVDGHMAVAASRQTLKVPIKLISMTLR